MGAERGTGAHLCQPLPPLFLSDSLSLLSLFASDNKARRIPRAIKIRHANSLAYFSIMVYIAPYPPAIRQSGSRPALDGLIPWERERARGPATTAREDRFFLLSLSFSRCRGRRRLLADFRTIAQRGSQKILSKREFAAVVVAIPHNRGCIRAIIRRAPALCDVSLTRDYARMFGCAWQDVVGKERRWT